MTTVTVNALYYKLGLAFLFSLFCAQSALASPGATLQTLQRRQPQPQVEIERRQVQAPVLVRRQSGIPSPDGVPPECKLDCEGSRGVLDGLPGGATSCPPSVCCSAGFQMGYFNCFKCIQVVADAPAQTLAEPQKYVDRLWASCDAQGFKQLPKLTYEGQDVDRVVPPAPLAVSPSTSNSTSTSSSTSSSSSTSTSNSSSGTGTGTKANVQGDSSSTGTKAESSNASSMVGVLDGPLKLMAIVMGVSMLGVMG